jgi:hypothetical protein
MGFAAMNGPIARRALVAVVFLGLCCIGFNAAFLLGMLGLPLSLWAISAAWTAASNGRQRLFQRRLVAVACGGVLLAGAPLSCSVQSRLLEQAVAPMLDALERYRADRGAYPKQLEELIPAYLTHLPECQGGPGAFDKPQYLLMDAKAGDAGPPGFVVTCYTYVFNKHSYHSTSRQWIDWD